MSFTRTDIHYVHEHRSYIHGAFPLLSPFLFACSPCSLFHLLGTLLAVTGSVHLGLRSLANWTSHFPIPCSLAPHSEILIPPRFLTPKCALISTVSRNWLSWSRTLRPQNANYVYMLVLSTLSKRKQNEALIMRIFLYQSKTNRLSTNQERNRNETNSISP